MRSRDPRQAPSSATDPTKNVLDLVHAEGRRQDDLRAMQDRLTAAEARRLDDLREMNDEHLRELINVRADGNQKLIEMQSRYEEKLRDKESQRIDAIRAVDVAALNRAQEVALNQAATLAAQVTTVADTFRTALTTELALIRKDIAELRESRSETAGGKAQVVEGRAAAGESRLNMGAVVGLLALLVAVVLPFILLLTR